MKIKHLPPSIHALSISFFILFSCSSCFSDTDFSPFNTSSAATLPRTTAPSANQGNIITAYSRLLQGIWRDADDHNSVLVFKDNMVYELLLTGCDTLASSFTLCYGGAGTVGNANALYREVYLLKDKVLCFRIDSLTKNRLRINRLCAWKYCSVPKDKSIGVQVFRKIETRK